jgi:hypothetical protein
MYEFKALFELEPVNRVHFEQYVQCLDEVVPMQRREDHHPAGP